MKYTILILSLFISLQVSGYVISKTDHGKNIHWSVRNDQIELFINPQRSGYNSYDLSNSEVESIISQSIAEWNSNSRFKIIPRFTNNNLSKGVSQTLTFTTNAAYFGSGTLAITSLGYDSSRGEILTADILVNESFFNNINFSDDPSMTSGGHAYLGDVITHEIGHFFGLAHSEAPGASMNYSVFKGMYSLAKDDIYGIKRLYGSNSGASISGKVVGGQSVGVFGTNVYLISYQTGELVANVITDSNGDFKFSALPSDNYFIYTGPIKSKTNLPTYYRSAMTNFCRGDYVPSYFTKCGGRDKGKPQTLGLEIGQQLDVGEVTIRCDSSHDPTYLKLKSQGFPQEYVLRNAGDQDQGQTFYGIFFKEEVENNSANSDKFIVDLSDVENDSANLYLDLKFQVEALSSAMELEVSVKRQDQASATIYKPTVESVTGKKLLNLVIRHPMSTTEINNIFEIEVKPVAIDISKKIEIFGTAGDLIGNQYYYSILQGVSWYNGNSYQLVGLKKSTVLEDNQSCTEGNVQVTNRAHLTSSGHQGNLDSGVETKVLSCGTVDFDSNQGPPPGGMGSFLLGLLTLLIPYFGRIRRSILLS